MNNQRLRDIRSILNSLVVQKYDEVGEDLPEGTLGSVQLGQEIGEAHTARHVLELIPEPEHDNVIDAWAISRVVDRKLYAEVDPRLPQTDLEHELHAIKFRIQERAVDKVKERIEDEVEETEAGGKILILQDPVSKCRYNSTVVGVEDEVELNKHQFARQIVERQ